MNESYTSTPRTSATVANYRLWVNVTRTVLVTLWDDGSMQIATRPDQYATWGPPVWLLEEKAP